MTHDDSNENPWISSNVYGGAFRFDEQNRLTVRPINGNGQPVEHDGDDMILDEPGSTFTRDVFMAPRNHDNRIVVARDEFTKQFKVVEFAPIIKLYATTPGVTIFPGNGRVRVEDAQPDLSESALTGQLARHARSYAIDGSDGWWCEVPFVSARREHGQGVAGFLSLRWDFDESDDDAATSFELRDPINPAFFRAIAGLTLHGVRDRLTPEPERFTRMGWDSVQTLRDFVDEHAAV